jgi:hypothetical protein
MSYNTYKGTFRPRNPNKYKGNSGNIVYRSRWELVLMRYLDDHPDVIEWSSEEIIIPYRSPIDNKVHRYFPDFFVKRKGKDGSIQSMLVEVKPRAQTVPPDVKLTLKGQKPSRRYINEVMTWGINSAKWQYAEAYCADRGWKFVIMTEKELGIKF